MIAFFDSNVHIDLLLGRLALDSILQEIGNLPVRLSPVVASELLRGVSGQAGRSVERLIARLLPLEPSSWRQCWYDTGRLLPRIFPSHEEIGLARLQNDLLLALTSRHTGALFVTTDAHFEAIRRLIPFRMRMLGSE
ncbi:MAG: PIN domain-containing protein [Deltaproteobacteria bacterium]|nr:PIN domain-containing protein [Deltaproteobacteria bacterium]